MGSAVAKCSCIEDHQSDHVDSDESLPPISSLYVPYQDRHRFIYDDRYLLDFTDQKIASKDDALGRSSPAQQNFSPRSFANDSVPAGISILDSESDQESVMTFISPSKDRTNDGKSR